MREPTAVWSLPKRLGFLFLAIFLALNAVPLVLFMVPYLGDTVFLELWLAGWNVVVVWLGEHVLGLPEPITILPNGSGDTTWNYVQLFGMVMFALIVAPAWAFADRRRTDYAGLHRGLTVVVRHALAAMLVSYGLVKLFKLQFPFPSLTTLTQTYGEASPMGLAWTFTGYSTPYNLFAGGAEVLAGALLLWRRTATVGALAAIAVMAHIVALNFSYDIPVKLFSSTLLLMGVYLLGDDGRRCLDFALGRPTAAAPLRPHFDGARARRLRVALKAGFVGLLAFQAVAVREMAAAHGPDAPKPALYGLYDVEGFELDGAERPPLLTDAPRWRHFIVEAGGHVVIRAMDGQRAFFEPTIDTAARTLTLREYRAGAPRVLVFTYERPTADELVLRGHLDAAPLTVRLRAVDWKQFLLVRRGFHWVNEYPYNR